MKGTRNAVRMGANGRERYCADCDSWKPETAEHFFERTKLRQDGKECRYYASKCRECHNAAYKSDGLAVGKHAEPPDLAYPSTINNPGTPAYEVAASPELLKHFNF